MLQDQQNCVIKKSKNKDEHQTLQVMRSQSQVALKSRLKCQNEADKKKHRSKLGMLEDANEITVRQTLDETIRQGVKTTK